jgi:nucleoside-diphosphate-sugar epimerase
MRVVVTGATGNVGHATIEALAAAPEITSVLGLARRRATAAWRPRQNGVFRGGCHQRRPHPVFGHFPHHHASNSSRSVAANTTARRSADPYEDRRPAAHDGVMPGRAMQRWRVSRSPTGG